MARLNTQLDTWVAAYRKASGLTQQELARLAGVSRQTVVEIEKGDYNPSVALALRLAVLLGVAVEELFQLPGTEVETLHSRRAEVPRQKEGDDDGVSQAVAAVEGNHRYRTR